MRLLILLVFALLVIESPAQKKKEKKPKIDGFLPVTINGKTLYVAETETTTTQWVEFIKYQAEAEALAAEDSVLVINPFNSCVRQMFFDKRAFYRDTTYKDSKGRKILSQVQCSRLPITGITFEQAQAYCDYLNSSRNIEFYPYPTFRLATPEEMAAIQQQSALPAKEMAAGVNDKGCMLLNYRHNSWCESNIGIKAEYGYAVPLPVRFFFPSNDGLWDVFGNVAEMTSEKGVAMGGSCKDVIADCQPGARNNYDGPAYWLGFRVVAELRNP
ncbi:MAG: formylglycine-generating enzyme family protein [Cyclobacteriaceae bacterium]|jgi:formylglycine-generating enzyme required for sulfatase activity